MNKIIPTEGMGATECVGSDCYPYTITIVVSPRKIVVRSDDCRRTDQNGAFTEDQQYEYIPNPHGEEKTLTLRKNGSWVEEGREMRCGSRFYIGERRAYRDPSF